jgi:septal ring factor EnvC (AmiA/AmiB activator)
MSRFDDDYDFDSPDESEDTDPLIRDLRAKIIRLEAQLDQLRASIREQTEESAIIAAQLAELQAEFVRLQARRRRDEKLLVLAWVLAVASLAMTVYSYLTM